MVHAGIDGYSTDGYSRMIVFLHCSSNNRASTVYKFVSKCSLTLWLTFKSKMISRL